MTTIQVELSEASIAMIADLVMKKLRENFPNALLTTEEAAEYLKIKPITLQKMRTTGNGPKYTNACGIRYYQKELDRWLHNHELSSTSEETVRRG